MTWSVQPPTGTRTYGLEATFLCYYSELSRSKASSRCRPSTVFPTHGHRGVTPSISPLGYVFSWRRLILATPSFGDCSSWAMSLLGDASLGRCLSRAMALLGDGSLGRCLSWAMPLLGDVFAWRCLFLAMPLSGDASLGRCLSWAMSDHLIFHYLTRR